MTRSTTLASSHFNPRSPWGERQGIRGNRRWNTEISIHAPRGGSDHTQQAERRHIRISIHAPRGGSDPEKMVCDFRIGAISIHAPRGGSDSSVGIPEEASTDFNPRSPWGERLQVFQVTSDIRIFQSTLPVGGATGFTMSVSVSAYISIHAPRGGSDGVYASYYHTHRHFNPRSPWGERRKVSPGSTSLHKFQSTLPVGGATFERSLHASDYIISIHAPRGGSDFYKRIACASKRYFNPRSPWGERRLFRLKLNLL